MSEEPNIQIIREIYAAFSRADVPAIVANLTDDVEWISHLDPIVPWSGDFSGKERVIKFFEAIFYSVDVEAFEPIEWTSAENTVISIGEFACRVRATGKRARARWAFLWKFRDGKVCSYEQFCDPALAEPFR